MEVADLEKVLFEVMQPIRAELHQLAENVVVVALELQRGNKVVSNRITGEAFERIKADRDDIQKRLADAKSYFNCMKARYPDLNWTKEDES